MAPTFKTLPFRGFLSSVLPASVMSSLDTTPGSKAVPRLDVPVPIFYWVEMITSRLQAWTSESVTVWRELIGYRLEKAYHCKFTSTHNEHEFVIYEFSNEQNMKLELRADRTVGERKGTLGTDSDSDFSSIKSSDTQSEESSPSASSPYFPNHRSSRSSSSLVSMKEGLSKVSDSLKQITRRLSDSSVSRPSAFSSNQYLADDRIVRIQGHPKKSEVLRTMTFKGDRAHWLSLWDIMILIQVVHDDSTMYRLLGRQCYWFADSMFGLLERWSTEHKNGTISTEPQRKSKWGMKRAQASTGSLGIVPVHRRDVDQMLKLWDIYLKERNDMDAQREGFERKLKREQEEKERQLRDQLRKEQAKRERRLKEEQEEKERQLRKEQEKRERRLKEEQEEKERQLRKEQEKRERRLKEEQEEKERQLRDQLRKEQELKERQLRDQLRNEQNEKDRRMAREQQVRDRRMREEQELKERQLTGQLRREQEENERRLREQFQQQLEDTHLQWQARFMQAMEENDRRFREITQMISSSNASLDEPAQILHPQSRS